MAADAVTAAGVGLRGRLALPEGLDRFMPPAVAPAPFEWAGCRGEKKEVEESPALLALLERWVKSDAEPPVSNLFLDVQRGPLMCMPVEGVADFSGVPDAIVVARGIGSREEAEPFAASAVFTVDWKRRSAMQVRGRIAAIGHVHALALASARGFEAGQPVFFTDLATGFRCWIVLNSNLYFFHDDAGKVDLSLAQGVALMRYFIARAAEGGALAVSDSALTSVRAPAGPSRRAPPAGGGVGSAAVPELAGAPTSGGLGASAHGAPAKSHGRGAAAAEESPESAATEGGDDGVDVDYRTLAVSIAHDLARGGGFSREGWE